MILTNKFKILAILGEVNEEAPGEFGYFDKAIYLYCDGCLFPSVLKDRKLSSHAAVPPWNRGKKAVKAAKKVISWALDNLPIDTLESRIYKDRKHVQMFARLSGMKYKRSDEKYDYYEASQ